jgi:phosphoglycerol transferase MdoB-like AlkP superfamily enzyme
MSVVRDGAFRTRARARFLTPSGQLSALVVWSASALMCAGLLYHHYRYEALWERDVFASAITAGLIATVATASRRALFSSALVAAVCALIVTASEVKRQFIDMVLHAYDVVFYLTSWSTLSFLWVDHKPHLLGLVAACIAIAGIARWLFRADSSRLNRKASAGVAVLCAVIAYGASVARGDRAHTLFYWDSLYLSSFYASWAETVETLWRGQLLEAVASQSKPSFAVPTDCTPGERPPHIILIHQESVVPPSQFPTLGYDNQLDPFFKSFDGRLHKLRVETYGGASWLTEFSILAGVSTYSFGNMRTFVQSLMQGKIRETLPQSLARCGYRNSLFYPVPKDFVSSGRFYSAVGMADVFDFKAQKAKRYNERDSFYYGNALDHMQMQLDASNGPLFTFIITSATHLPYTSKYEPHVNVPGGKPGTEPEMNEYLRRVAMAKIDLDAFRADLQRRFPAEKFLLFQYGDHQPIATRTLLGYNQDAVAENVKLSPESPGLITYYAIEGINYDPPPMPLQKIVDVPYLSTILLQSARLPLTESYQERARLMRVCDGRYYTCPMKTEILSFHRRLMDSGLVDAR